MPSDRASYTTKAPLGKGPGPLPPAAKLTGPHSRDASKGVSIANRGDTGSGRGTAMNTSLNARRKAGQLPGAGQTPKPTKPGV